MANFVHRVRWTVQQAAGEFPINHKTLAERIRKAGIEPGPDQKFSTAQICQAAFGDLRGEQTRLAKENADARALENEKRRGTLVAAESVYKFYVSVFVKIRQVILCSDLSDDEKADLLAELRRAAQRKNGEHLYG